MSHYLSIKLKQIKYSGGNIGREIKLRLKIEDQISRINIKLPCGKSRTFDKVVFQKTLKQKTLSLPITAEIKETSERFEDFGLGTSKFKMQLKNSLVKNHIFNIDVKGAGGDKGKTGKFTIVLEAKVESAIRYVSDVRPNGWLKVKFDNGDIHPLPQLLKVEITKIENDREYFNILEGGFKGRKASVRLREDGKSYLSEEGKHTGPAKLVFDDGAKKLTIIGLGAYNTNMDAHNPIPRGEYDLEIPYEPHLLGESYMKYSKYAKTWFRIGHKGDRFLHVGRISEGCITVTDKTKWTEIYNFLIKSRKDSLSVGEVIIK